MPMNDPDPAAILFDLDGVIIDSEPLSEKAFRQTSLHLGRDLNQEEVASLKARWKKSVPPSCLNTIRLRFSRFLK
jgi:phosphoglycolate phosphatase-like HAD superfamily hydrolase